MKFNYRRILLYGMAGAVTGLLVLGIGGRLLMRILAFITPEPPRLTIIGTAEILAAGTIWGAITAPLLVWLDPFRSRIRSGYGPAFGILVMALALALFLLFSGFDGTIVAPPLFVVGTFALFPVLFLIHGTIVAALAEWISERG